jgi:MSHA biogenesis protein MshJ
MKARLVSSWDVQAARINALSLRERMILFFLVVAISIVLVDEVWLSPAQLSHQQLTQRFDKQSADLQRGRDELMLVGTSVDVNKALRDEIAAARISLDTVRQVITSVSEVMTDESLPQVLVHLLRRHAGLTLLYTTYPAPQVVVGKADQAVGVDDSLRSGGLTRQDVELKVSGPYLELVRYVETLEDQLPQVRWGSMKLKSETPLTELTLELFVVGEDPR